MSGAWGGEWNRPSFSQGSFAAPDFGRGMSIGAGGSMHYDMMSPPVHSPGRMGRTTSPPKSPLHRQPSQNDYMGSGYGFDQGTRYLQPAGSPPRIPRIGTSSKYKARREAAYAPQEGYRTQEQEMPQTFHSPERALDRPNGHDDADAPPTVSLVAQTHSSNKRTSSVDNGISGSFQTFESARRPTGVLKDFAGWVMVYGFPIDERNAVSEKFQQYGDYEREPIYCTASNWMLLKYKDVRDAEEAISQSGMFLNPTTCIAVDRLTNQTANFLGLRENGELAVAHETIVTSNQHQPSSLHYRGKRSNDEVQTYFPRYRQIDEDDLIERPTKKRNVCQRIWDWAMSQGAEDQL